MHTAFALNLDGDGKVGGLLAILWLEGLEQLETVALGVNGDVDAGTVSRGLLVTGVISTGRQPVARGI